MMNDYWSRMMPKGQCPSRKPIRKILWSGVGSFLGIFLLAWLAEAGKSDDRNRLFLIASLGASAVLIYGAPLADFSQPRNLIGGHVLSAIIGVTTNLVWPHHMAWASAVAVSSAIIAMHFTSTLHPPGGATALIAVIGNESIKSLGYWYVLNPVLFGAILLLLIALVVNNLSANPRRHYPVYWF